MRLRLPFHRDRPLTLALQGGGAHGAFTWGVLDYLLEVGSFDIRGITGTSAGAVNAVALADGLVSGGPEEARRRLEEVWTQVGENGPSEWVMSGSDERPSLSMSAQLAMQLTRSLSPAQLNPFGIDPLGDVLGELIDFERLRDDAAPRLGLAATHARTGRLQIFGNADMQRDVVLASACLPSLRSAVQIDGQPYWDGGYTANPPLIPVLDFAPADTLIVLICPTAFDSTPRTATQIRAREQEFAFTAGFFREVELLADATRRAEQGRLLHGPLERSLRRMRWHLIEAGEALTSLPSQTRVIAHLPFLKSLRDKGRAIAQEWLAGSGQQVGRRSSAQLADLSQIVD